MHALRYPGRMNRGRLPSVLGPLVVTTLLSLTLLPLVIPPFRPPSMAEVGEVLLWQTIANIGWPVAIAGAILSLATGAVVTDPTSLALLLAYPFTYFILLRSLAARTVVVWHAVLLNALVLATYAGIWYGVGNGYSFMSG